MKATRTFIALELEPGVRRRVIQLQGDLEKAGPEVKWVEEENLHLTLLFLGEVRELDLVTVCRAVDRVTEDIEPFTLEFGGLGAFPNLRRPKVLYAELTQGKEDLVKLHQTIELPLLDAGCYRREARPYTPHLTLGRLSAEDETGTWAAIFAKHNDWYGGEMLVKEVLVMGSQLTKNSPIYSVLARGQLRG
jgi:RNA 2',3'-cyclic 3'-phosphodiesterase